VEFAIKGDSLLVKDLGSKTAMLEGAARGQTDVPWRVGQTGSLGLMRVDET